MVTDYIRPPNQLAGLGTHTDRHREETETQGRDKARVLECCEPSWLAQARTYLRQWLEMMMLTIDKKMAHNKTNLTETIYVLESMPAGMCVEITISLTTSPWAGICLIQYCHCQRKNTPTRARHGGAININITFEHHLHTHCHRVPLILGVPRGKEYSDILWNVSSEQWAG